MDITIGRVGITYGGQLDLRDVLIRYHHEDTLIYSQNVATSLTSFKSLLNNNPTLGSTTAGNLQFNLKIYEGEDRDNLSIFLNKLKTEKKKQDSSFIMTIDDMDVIGGSFSYINENATNPEFVVIDKLNLNAGDFLLEDSEIFVNVRKLSGYEKRGLKIDFLSTVDYAPDTEYGKPVSEVKGYIPTTNIKYVTKGYGNGLEGVGKLDCKRMKYY